MEEPPGREEAGLGAEEESSAWEVEPESAGGVSVSGAEVSGAEASGSLREAGGEPEVEVESVLEEGAAVHPVRRKHKQKIISFFIAASWEKERGEDFSTPNRRSYMS